MHAFVKWSYAQGFAYVEFLEADAVAAACLLADSELHGRALKVCHYLVFHPQSVAKAVFD